MVEAGDHGFAGRLREAVSSLGTQKEAAAKTGIPYATLQRVLAGKTDVGIKRLELIARAAGFSVDYILRGESSSEAVVPSLRLPPTVHGGLAQEPSHLAEARAPELHPAHEPDLVLVQEIDLRFGMGATDLEVPVTSQVRHFSREWLRQYTRANPEKVYFAQGIGDSMAPTIHDSDLLLIDTSETSIRMADKIWAVAYSGSGMVKRLRQTADGVRILSDNPAVPDEVAYDGELHVLGRVVGIFRKL